MTPPLNIAFIGLSLSSSWGNGHATTYRALLQGLAMQGHRLLFLERDVPWYASQRDLVEPDYCELRYYSDLDGLRRFAPALREADVVVIGSYVPEGVQVTDFVASLDPRLMCFYDIDTPVTLAKLDRREEEYIARRQISLFDAYFSFTGGEMLDRLENQYGAWQAFPLYCCVDANRYAPSGEPLEWDLGYLGTFSPDRQPALERLLLEPARRLPDRRFVVAGSQYPANIAWPSNVERIEHLPPSQHASFYSRQRFTLNVTRADMVTVGWSPSVRLFEAGACGTPIISDRWRGLSDIFPENEAILIADSTEDVVDALTAISEDRRQDIRNKARSLVLAGHTGEARAAELAQHLHACLGAKSRMATSA